MHETDQAGEWFYTQAGERLGPVAFQELRRLAAENAIDPRLDLVWCQSLDNWKPAGEIEGLFERRAIPAATPKAYEEAGAYTPPGAHDISELMAHHGAWPGSSRRVYLGMSILLPIVFGLGITFGLPFFAAIMPLETLPPLAIGLWLLMSAMMIYYLLERFANLGMSRWWFFGGFIPFLNLWLSYRCIVCPAGYAYHRKLDGPGIVLAILFWGICLLSLLLLVLSILLFVGMIGSPEFQEAFKQHLETLPIQPPAEGP
jgi:hypothetical protein